VKQQKKRRGDGRDMRRTIVVMGMLTVLSGCGGFSESRLNPFTWFGGGSDAPDTLVPVDQVLFADSRPLIPEVARVEIDPTPGGIILRAVGLPPTEGFWDGELIVENANPEPVDGVLSFQFRILPPPFTAAPGTPRTREITVGRFITWQELDGVTVLRVVGERNERTIRP
jgi:hypothetical protein